VTFCLFEHSLSVLARSLPERGFLLSNLFNHRKPGPLGLRLGEPGRVSIALPVRFQVSVFRYLYSGLKYRLGVSSS
jgi:hypothetical protein